MRNIIKQYFTFNKREASVIGFLAFLVVLLIALQFLIPSFFASGRSFKLKSADSIKITDFLSSLKTKEDKPYLNRLDKYIENLYDTINLFNFDPNTVSKPQLRKLGLTDKQANNVLNYRNRGGHFDAPDNFRKIYSIRTKQYQILKPYIKINTTKARQKFSKNKKAIQLFSFDPNFVSKDSLQLLGFSTKVAARILKFRKHYFFKNKKSLLKVYGVDSLLYASLVDSMKIDSSKLPLRLFQINLNRISESKLIDKYKFKEETALNFVKYRGILGGFYSKNQIFEVRGIDSLKAEKLQSENYLDTSRIRRFDINTKKFKYHPYFRRDAKDKLRRYRLSHDDFNSLEEIRKSGIFTPKEWNKIKYYLRVN